MRTLKKELERAAKVIAETEEDIRREEFDEHRAAFKKEKEND
jgi:hypothetical protein